MPALLTLGTLPGSVVFGNFTCSCLCRLPEEASGSPGAALSQDSASFAWSHSLPKQACSEEVCLGPVVRSALTAALRSVSTTDTPRAFLLAWLKVLFATKGSPFLRVVLTRPRE